MRKTTPRYFSSKKDANSLISLVHSKLHSITPVETKVHVISHSFVVLTYMHDTIELV